MDDPDQARFLVIRNAAEENAIAWKGKEKAPGVRSPGGRRAIMNQDPMKGSRDHFIYGLLAGIDYSWKL